MKILDGAEWPLLDDTTVLPGDGPGSVTIERFLQDPRADGFPVRISSVGELDRLRPRLDRAAAIDIFFPAFNRGEGYSLARRLRKHHKWVGQLLASGDIRTDQIEFLGRCGFDVAILAPGQSRDRSIERSKVFNRRYQPDRDGDLGWIANNQARRVTTRTSAWSLSEAVVRPGYTSLSSRSYRASVFSRVSWTRTGLASPAFCLS